MAIFAVQRLSRPAVLSLTYLPLTYLVHRSLITVNERIKLVSRAKQAVE